MIDKKLNKGASEIVKNDTSFPRTHILKVPNRALVKPLWIILAVFLVCPLILDIPWTDRSFPPHIIEITINVLKVSLVLMVILVVILTFHRRKLTVTLSNKGIQFSDEDILPWQIIQWYRIDVFSAKGVRKIVLRIRERKIWIIADDVIEFGELEKEIRELIGIYNPLAKDYNTLKVSRNWGYFYIALFTTIYMGISYLTSFEVKYLLIFTPTLLFIIMLIYVEKIKRTGKAKP